jgi:hypothetical protein
MKTKFEFFLSKFVFVFLIVIPMCFVMTVINTGFTASLIKVYPRNFIIAFLVAYPCSMIITPIASLVTKKLLLITKKKQVKEDV